MLLKSTIAAVRAVMQAISMPVSDPKPIVTQRIAPNGDRYVTVRYPEPHTILGQGDYEKRLY